MLHSVKDKYSSSQSPAGLGMPALGVILRERQGYRSVVLNEAKDLGLRPSEPPQILRAMEQPSG